jgi:hypothetical protein
MKGGNPASVATPQALEHELRLAAQLRKACSLARERPIFGPTRHTPIGFQRILIAMCGSIAMLAAGPLHRALSRRLAKRLTGDARRNVDQNQRKSAHPMMPTWLSGMMMRMNQTGPLLGATTPLALPGCRRANRKEYFPKPVHVYRVALRETDEELLSVSSADTFSTRWLVPRLASFELAHPNITVRIESMAFYPGPAATDGVLVPIQKLESFCIFLCR